MDNEVEENEIIYVSLRHSVALTRMMKVFIPVDSAPRICKILAVKETGQNIILIVGSATFNQYYKLRIRSVSKEGTLFDALCRTLIIRADVILEQLNPSDENADDSFREVNWVDPEFKALIAGMSGCGFMFQVKLQPGIYKHFKGGFYQVEGVREDTDSGKQFVVYQALYGEGCKYVRELSLFMAETTDEKGNVVPRYVFINNIVGSKITASGNDCLLTVDDICKKLNISRSTFERIRRSNSILESGSALTKINKTVNGQLAKLKIEDSQAVSFPKPTVIFGRSPRWIVKVLNDWISGIAVLNFN